MSEIVVEVKGGCGRITLNRPQALNALSLAMIRELHETLRAWCADAAVQVVAIRGQGKEGAFGAFCAGGDIRFFHQAALAGDPRLEDFFDEEYALDHFIHNYPKPVVAFMDGIVMGGGMGISQGARLRIVTERTKMAMPETNIGLFPDVGGGYFLGRCPGRVGEYLALTGRVLGGGEAVAAGLADVLASSGDLAAQWNGLATHGLSAFEELVRNPAAKAGREPVDRRTEIDRFFALPSVVEIVIALENDSSHWAHDTAAMLRKRSPLMLNVTLEQVRRGRGMGLADDLRMERDLMHHCFQLRPGARSETVEGIRAAVIDKDQQPRWNPARIEDVTPAMWEPFFRSPWTVGNHPLRTLT